MTREEAKTILIDKVKPCLNGTDWEYALDMAIKALEQNESAEEWYKLFVEKLEQEPILDKIRAEIEQIAKDYDKFADYRRVRGLWIALEIIDKYKAEGEEE